MKYGTLVRLKKIEDLEHSFKRLKAMGFDSCQLVYKPENYDMKDALTVKQIALDQEVEISAFFAGFYDDYTLWDIKYDFKNAGLNSKMFGAERLEYVLKAVEFAANAGITDVVIHAGFIPNNPFCQDYADMLCVIKLLADRAKNTGNNILFETGGESPVTLLRIIEEIGTGNLFVNLDTGNLVMYGYGNPCDAVYTIGKYIRNVHIKDGLPPTQAYKIGKETRIGEGAVDFKRFICLLDKIGYDRFITIEREIDGDQQARDIEYALNFIKKLKGE